MKTEQEYAADPWYKQPWLLLALVPLVATVIAGTTFLVVSIQSSDGIVKEDHYRKSKGYFKDSTKQQLAFDKKIAANIAIDNITGDLSIKLSGDLTPLPKLLSIDFVSPTHQKYDINVILKQVADQAFYLGSLPSPLAGKRYLMVTPQAQNGRLSDTILPPYDSFNLELKAEQPK